MRVLSRLLCMSPCLLLALENLSLAQNNSRSSRANRNTSSQTANTQAASDSSRANQGNSNRRNDTAATQPSEEPDTSTQPLDGDKEPGSTSSGQREGVGDANPFPEPDEKKDQPNVPAIVGSGGALRRDEASQAHLTTRKNARTITLAVPAPRGQIVDRNGLPMAQNVVAYQVALEFGQLDTEDEAKIVAYGREKINQAQAIIGKVWEISDKQLWEHYRHRRWLPLPLSNVIHQAQKEKIAAKLPAGLAWHPIYVRVYPEKAVGGHFVGYVGSYGKLPTGPINHMDPLWEHSVGRSGLEKEFDKQLNGTPGVWRLLFDEEGNNLLNELAVKPKPGGTLVTTINLEWQRKAEQILGKLSKRGAMVVLDIESGEVLVMASNPSFDPNVFVPNISREDYQNLLKDPNNPLVSRAYKGVYPPASTFKVIVALSALANNAVRADEKIYCPAAITIGNHTFNNWSKTPEGSIDVVKAISRSCNPYFYQVGIRVGPNAFLDEARNLGMGQRSGLPIDDVAGLIPTENWMRRVNRRGFYDGDTANLSIGQGVLLTTPLQVAHAMAGIANDQGLPKLQLVRQVHDDNGNVIYAMHPEIKTPHNVAPQALHAVREGMYEVVNGSNGTGGRAKLSYTTLCGKTGTAQWGPKNEDKRLAWFAGFFPYEKPKYAFAVLYEGVPREMISGGKKAAPIVSEFFESIKSDVKPIISPPKPAEKPITEVPQVVDPQTLQPIPNQPGGNNPDTPAGEPDDGEVPLPRPVVVDPETLKPLP